MYSMLSSKKDSMASVHLELSLRREQTVNHSYLCYIMPFELGARKEEYRVPGEGSARALEAQGSFPEEEAWMGR